MVGNLNLLRKKMKNVVKIFNDFIIVNFQSKTGTFAINIFLRNNSYNNCRNINSSIIFFLKILSLNGLKCYFLNLED